MELIKQKLVVDENTALYNLISMMDKYITLNKQDKGDWQSWSHELSEDLILERMEDNISKYKTTEDTQYLAHAANNIMFLFEKKRLSWKPSS